MKKRYFGIIMLCFILINKVTYAQSADKINTRLELSLGGNVTVNNTVYKYFSYANSKKIQLPVASSYNKDAIHIGISKNFKVTSRIIIAPVVEFNYIRKNEFDVRDTTIESNVMSIPILLTGKIQILKGNQFRHYLIAGIGYNSSTVELLNIYKETGAPVYRAGYSFIFDKSRIGAGCSLDFCTYNTSQSLRYNNEFYYFNYKLKRKQLSIYLLKRF